MTKLNNIPNIPLGTKVKVKVPKRFCITINDFIKAHTVIGHVKFIGFNDFLNKHQITIDRLPVDIDDWKQIKVLQ